MIGCVGCLRWVCGEFSALRGKAGVNGYNISGEFLQFCSETFHEKVLGIFGFEIKKD